MTAPTALVVEALRAESARRLRAGLKLALELEDLRAAGTDVRTRSVRLVTWLAGAARLEQHADQLERPAPVPILPAGASGAELAAALEDTSADPRGAGALDVDVPDDGLSPEAQRAAQLAGLDPTVLEEEPETGATAEDDVDGPLDHDLDALAGIGKADPA